MGMCSNVGVVQLSFCGAAAAEAAHVVSDLEGCDWVHVYTL